MNGRRGICGLEGSNIFVSSPPFPAPSSCPMSTASTQAQVFMFQKLSNSLMPPAEDA
jgi:hypothetical protein